MTKPSEASLHKHAAKHGHLGHNGDAYVKGAMNQRHGVHERADLGHLINKASGHGFSGDIAKAYALGAQHEAQGVHDTEPDAGTQDAAE